MQGRVCEEVGDIGLKFYIAGFYFSLPRFYKCCSLVLFAFPSYLFIDISILYVCIYVCMYVCM